MKAFTCRPNFLETEVVPNCRRPAPAFWTQFRNIRRLSEIILFGALEAHDNGPRRLKGAFATPAFPEKPALP